MKYKLIAGGAAAVTAAAAAGLPFSVDRTEYTVVSGKVNNAVKIVLLSDLHNNAYGSRMEKLLSLIEAEHPDLIVMPGDMAEEHHRQDNTMILFEALKQYPCYYCTGNHEEYRWDLTELKQKIEASGVHVLENSSAAETIGSTVIEIAGIPCRLDSDEFTPEEIDGLFQSEGFHLLMSHRPEWVKLYNRLHADLIVCGHAHGGQFRIPFTNIGIVAPSQGFFPKYTQGVYPLNHGEMIVSRGLSRHYHGIPRLYNNPELVVIHLLPKEEGQ